MKRRFLCVYFPFWSINLRQRNLTQNYQQQGHQQQEDPSSKQKREYCPPELQENSAYPNKLLHKPHLPHRFKGMPDNAGDAGNSNDICSGEGHAPLILYFPSSGSTPSTVAAACLCAQRRGAHRGTPLALALAMLPPATCTAPLCIEKDFALLCRLARWALKFSPLVALDAELIESFERKSLASASPLHFGFCIDLTGTERVHGGERHVLERLTRAFSSRSLLASFAIAPSYGAAWALSRSAPSSPVIIQDSVASEEALRQALAPLSLEALRLDQETHEALTLLGITRIEQLLALPPKKLSTRFPNPQGPHGVLTRIRQALGTQYETLRYIHPPTIIRESFSFEIPLSSHTQIERAILELLEKVFARLVREGKTTRSIVLEIISLNADRQSVATRKELSLCHATRDIAHARSVIAPLVESIQAAEGIAALHVTARLTVRARSSQHPLLREISSDEGFYEQSERTDELINQLVTRLGADRVACLEPCSSYLPERAFAYRPIGSSPPTPLRASPSPRGPFMQRPSYLFETPRPVSAIAMLPDKPPSQLMWEGTRLKVTVAEGPERICLEWWQHSLAASQITTHGNNASRDYFRIQDDTGRWLWVFRDNTSSEWFVHGMWV